MRGHRKDGKGASAPDRCPSRAQILPDRLNNGAGNQSSAHSAATPTIPQNTRIPSSPDDPRGWMFAQLDRMGPEALQGALVALDELSRPLTAREIEHALRRHGVAKSRAVLFGASLSKLSIIAIVGGEE